MRAVLIYESMFGGTKAVAEAAAKGISSRMETRVIRAADAMSQQFEGVDLVVVGAPTHAHGLPRPSTRKGAPNYVNKANGDLMLEPGADSAVGVREWLSSVGKLDARCAAFDTRANGPGFLTGRASKTIARVLKKRGASLVASPQSFLTKGNKLVSGELERASAWGESLVGQLVPAPMP